MRPAQAPILGTWAASNLAIEDSQLTGMLTVHGTAALSLCFKFLTIYFTFLAAVVRVDQAKDGGRVCKLHQVVLSQSTNKEACAA
ncbi:hypothetical protein PMKS-001494 [Pichia membranifaciens]|uniref:Uncharacterized protein n=1 Tax=Pichia membranifaciens TaxID=4926 RepID=A0A1Q2YEN9_9ASCO|nr:hypothetical protein PMKS-001494 [Pichia membranifaciens]